MPDRFESRYVFVNLADYFLKLVDTIKAEERTVFTSEVVVGKPYHETPEFSDRIRYLVINPYWNVPPSIATKELLPRFKADPSYARAKHYEILDSWAAGAKTLDPQSIDWSTISEHRFPFKIRQMPGADNALGKIKFMFPNPHNIYLHDTPSKELFSRTRRAFSHGCIRVDNALVLATALLAWQPGWPKERIVEAINSGKRMVVSLAEPIPIHLAYITAWANKDGSVHFREDIYGRDALLKNALFGGSRDINFTAN
jgi:murein L,D-transpeptidase YcbB/YkuD